ncbi:unnamed protein product [Adineta steineri]|uniref:NAD(P)(+)--arginine ADP-ribosyltransferase n=1 Tax=Adineta steineri TaxID=433720 RepID=A0A815VRG1_9BILA|nr:unnamed protein product [Adineta steineri]
MAAATSTKFTVIWLDSLVNANEENLATQQKLFNNFHDVNIFEDGDECQRFIESEPDKSILLIISGRLSRQLIPAIDQLKQMRCIYIYCMNKTYHEEWARGFDKVKAIVTKLDELIAQIKSDISILKKTAESMKVQDHTSTSTRASSTVVKPVIKTNNVTTSTSQASEMAVSVKKTSCALDGFEKESILSLEEATAPLAEIVADIDQMVWIVKQNSQNPEQGLSSDESASIALYTMEWYPKENSFFYILNEALRSENRQQMKPWFRYLKLVFQALSKLKTVSNIVYHGTNTDISKDYPKGKIFVNWEFLNCTPSINTLESEEHFGKEGQRTLFTIDCRSGTDISRHAFDQAKSQVLFFPGCQFQVVSCLSPSHGLNIIQLEEMKSPYSFK